MKKKIVLGTAQLNLSNYGITDERIDFSKHKILDLLNFAWDKGIKYFDTAPIYKNEKIIGEFIKKKKINSEIKILTKVESIKNLTSLYSETSNSLENSMKDLNINKIHTLFFHQEKDFYKIIKEKFFFEKLKKNYNIQNFGISVYSKLLAKKILNFYPFMSLQFPFNIINYTFQNLKKKKSLFFARSVFCQGLLTSNKIKNNDLILKKKHTVYVEYLKKNKINPINLCIDFMDKKKDIDFILFGIKSKEQLLEIINYKKKKINNENEYLKIQKIFKGNFNDPRKWKV